MPVPDLRLIFPFGFGFVLVSFVFRAGSCRAERREKQTRNQSETDTKPNSGGKSSSRPEPALEGPDDASSKPLYPDLSRMHISGRGAQHPLHTRPVRGRPGLGPHPGHTVTRFYPAHGRRCLWKLLKICLFNFSPDSRNPPKSAGNGGPGPLRYRRTALGHR